MFSWRRYVAFSNSILSLERTIRCYRSWPWSWIFVSISSCSEESVISTPAWYGLSRERSGVAGNHSATIVYMSLVRKAAAVSHCARPDNPMRVPAFPVHTELARNSGLSPTVSACTRLVMNVVMQYTVIAIVAGLRLGFCWKVGRPNHHRFIDHLGNTRST